MHRIGNIHKYARRICGSAPCSSPPPQMMKRKKEKYGWEFIFLRANIGAMETVPVSASGRDRAVTYHSDSGCTRLNYAVMSGTICAVRKTGTLSVDWKTRSDEDFKKRKKK